MVNAPAVARRARHATGRAAVLRDRRTDARTRVVGRRCQAAAAPDRARGWGPQASGAAPTPPCSCCRVAARRHPLAADPAPAGALAPLHDRHLSRDLLGGDHLHRPRPARAGDARQRRPGPVERSAGAPDCAPATPSTPAAAAEATIACPMSSSPPRGGRNQEHHQPDARFPREVVGSVRAVDLDKG